MLNMRGTAHTITSTPIHAFRLHVVSGSGIHGAPPERFGRVRNRIFRDVGFVSGGSKPIFLGDWHRRTSMKEVVPSTGGDDGGDDGSGGGKSTDEEEGDDSEKSPIDVLIEGGSTMKDLPKDMQAAMQNGILTVDHVTQWLAIIATPILAPICRAVPGFRDRVMGNPRFLLQVCLELFVGVVAKTIAEKEARKENFYKEMPFVLSDLALEVLGDFSLVWLLSSKASFKPAATSKFGKIISSIPGHTLQRGNFSLGQRALTLVYRGGQFFLVGFGCSAVGHSITKAAVEAQEVPEGEEPPVLAPVLDNSIGWASFMGLSSNLRYQTVNFVEESVLDAFVPSKLLNVPLTFSLRFANCFLGGVQWVWFAKTLGLQ
ncbi:hypothetical protein BSKO_07416 [Bryopsis sp. KO-2023]|nr:hypothetical protein BSKO_07416 [Bryopsis sp. KO-2023]